MTFADEIEKVASTRFSLVRLEPARQINNIWTSIGGGLYEYEFTEDVSRILEEGTALTKVTGTPASGEWSQDETTKKVTVFPISGSAVVIMFYYLFYTSDYDRLFPSSVTSGDNVCWNGRILSDPSVTQSINNIVNSFTLTSSTSNVSLANADADFQKYLTDEDSFANKNADSWVVVNGEIQKIFTGKILSIRLGTNDVSLSLNDSLSLGLNEIPTYGESRNENFATKEDYTDITSEDENRPIPIIFGVTNNQAFDGKYFSRQADGDQGRFVLSDTSNYTAINIDSTDNLEFILCRIPTENDLRTYSLGASLPDTVSFTGIANGASAIASRTDEAGGSLLNLSSPNLSVEVGDHFTYTTSNGTSNAVITYVNAAKDEVGFLSESKADFGDETVTSVSAVTKTPALLVNISGSNFIPIPGRDFTTSITSQTNTKIIKVAFVSDWEDEAVNSESLLTGDSPSSQDPMPDMTSKAKVFYRIITDNVLDNHSDVFKSIMNKQGFTTNDSSFSSAKSAFDANVLFSIPFVGESKYSPIKVYIERILESTISSISINGDDELVYNLVEAPSSGTTIDDDIYLKRSFSVSLSYRDIATDMIWQNEHDFITTTVRTSSGTIEAPINLTSSTKITYQNSSAKYLHSKDSTKTINHILQDITVDDRYKKLLDLRSERFVNYKYTTSAQSLLDIINDDITISDPSVLGGSGTVNTKITAFTKDDDKVTITVSDLLGL